MSNYIEGKTGRWEYVIGLEIHAQISSKSKLFSNSSTGFGAEANSQVSFVDAALPGMLPVLNEVCVKQAIKTSIGINAKVNHMSAFDRKNYFYPDLPQGYQISQFYHPIAQHGFLDIQKEDGSTKRINIERLHMEQDAGKSIHDGMINHSLIDLNRAGVGLMEIVSAPELSSPFEAGEYVKNLRMILRYLETCDGDMEKGSFRCDANVSVRKPGEPLGTRCEIKNLNSIKYIMAAIEYEAARQIEILENGGSIDQETRLFDVDLGITKCMRSKEDALDYRYFPDPDLLPLILEDQYIQDIKNTMPELPDAKYLRYTKDYNISQDDAKVLISDKITALYFEQTISLGASPKVACNWIIGELFSYMNKASIQINECKITPHNLCELLQLMADDTISSKIAKQVFEQMFETGKSARVIVEEANLVQISDPSLLQQIIDEIVEQNPSNLQAYKSGKDKLFGFFVGQVMKKTDGKANPTLLNDLLKNTLDS